MIDAPSRAPVCAVHGAADRHLIGIIILAGFLKLPLTSYEAVIEKVEGSHVFTRLSPGTFSTKLFPRAQVRELAKSLAPNCIGQLREDQQGFHVSYRYPGLASEYVIDEGKMMRWRQGQALSSGDEGEIQALRRQLRLISTRNRLTHMVLMGIAEHQGDYLASADRLDLKPLSQVALTEWIRGELQGDSRFLPLGSKLEFVDNSMISRLTRDMSVLSPQGREISLRGFLSSSRDVHKRMIEAILDREKERIRRGDIQEAYTDEEIKEKLKERYSVSISRRTVSACRRDMRIPSSYTRNGNHTYPPRQTLFSFHYPLKVASVKGNAPEGPGVYEISLADLQVDYPLCFSEVVYIGSAKNLRKRLGDHLRPGAKNSDLRALLAKHRAVFRYIVKHSGPRAEERRLCRSFVSASGSLPRCNRIRP